MKCGLIGKNIEYSYSATIHSSFGNNDYKIYSIDEDILESFILNKDYSFLNVTIPYKKEVIKYLDKMDDAVKLTNVCNLIVNDKGTLIGYNTDYLALKHFIEKSDYTFKDKTILILGSGATSLTCKEVLKSFECGKVYIASRKKEDGFISYDKFDSIKEDVDVIINTTPVGTYPFIYDQIIDITKFNKVTYVLDYVYNPLRTRLLIDADEWGCQSVNGLPLLVLQAYFTELITNNISEDESLLSVAYKEVLSKILNIVLIGMPTCGKSKIGKLTAFDMKYGFVDLDNLFKHVYNITPKDYINELGEDSFRDKETHLAEQTARMKHLIISTGGGVIKREENIKYLKANGVVIFLDRPKADLHPSLNNPLSDDLEKLYKMFDERYPIYKKLSDYIIDATYIDKSIEQIKEIYNENLNIKWF